MESNEAGPSFGRDTGKPGVPIVGTQVGLTVGHVSHSPDFKSSTPLRFDPNATVQISRDPGMVIVQIDQGGGPPPRELARVKHGDYEGVTLAGPNGLYVTWETAHHLARMADAMRKLEALRDGKLNFRRPRVEISWTQDNLCCVVRVYTDYGKALTALPVICRTATAKTFAEATALALEACLKDVP